MSGNDPKNLRGVGLFLEKQKRKPVTWRLIMFGALGIIVILNFFIHNHHPHFGWDARPGAWVIFGLGVGLLMVLLAKKIVQPLIKKREDFYGDL